MKSNYTVSMKNSSSHRSIDKMLDCIPVFYPILSEQIVDISISLYLVNDRINQSIITKIFSSGPPEITRSHIDIHPSVVRGSSITLSCPYTTERTSLITITNTTWIPPSSSDQIRRSFELNENQLIISNVQFEDGRIWKCIVANEYGSDSLEFQLEVLGKQPHKKMSFCIFSPFQFHRKSSMKRQKNYYKSKVTILLN